MGVSAKMLFEFLPLFFDVWGNLLINILKQAVNWWQQFRRCILKSTSHLLKGILTESLRTLLVNQTLFGQVFLKPCNRVREFLHEFLPFLHFFLITVSLGEIAR